MGPAAKRRIRITIGVVVALVALWIVASLAAAWKLTRRPRAPFVETIPESLRDATREMRLRTSDGFDLGAWWIEGTADRPVVLLLHGIGGARSSLVPKITILARHGFGLLAVSLRASGDSTGATTDVGFSARHDVVCAVEWARAREPARPIVIDGASMGGVAASLAAGALGDRVDGYVFECMFQDLRTAVANRLEDRVPKPLDLVAWAGLRLAGPLFLPDFDATAPVEAVRAIPKTTPVLVLASLADKSARPFEARAIHARVASHGELVFFELAAHDRLVETEPERWETTVVAFVERCAARGGR